VLLCFRAPIHRFDIWQEKALGAFTGSFVAKGVAMHGTAFLRLTPSAGDPLAPQTDEAAGFYN